MSNCKICDCPLVRLTTASGQLEKRTKCIRCIWNSKPSVSKPCPSPKPKQKLRLLLDNRQAVVAARRAYYKRAKQALPTAEERSSTPRA